ncbi:hypothetical protein M9H77_35249 [Catharanthus roseus]|uniref:Uncharacterized protein n=1 Tax=Catharanthus roseus TaxID=4058 RepID=A0ACB9ZQ74_CATRO|nr:hypothetical protein M9H77_35249 [Catharanthus roseus]
MTYLETLPFLFLLADCFSPPWLWVSFSAKSSSRQNVARENPRTTVLLFEFVILVKVKHTKQRLLEEGKSLCAAVSFPLPISRIVEEIRKNDLRESFGSRCVNFRSSPNKLLVSRSIDAELTTFFKFTPCGNEFCKCMISRKSRNI